MVTIKRKTENELMLMHDPVCTACVSVCIVFLCVVHPLLTCGGAYDIPRGGLGHGVSQSLSQAFVARIC